MQLYDGIGPNPRMVRMFLHERGVAIPSVQVDILAGENRRAPHTERNPMGQLPALALDGGRWLAEITAICGQPQPRRRQRRPARVRSGAHCTGTAHAMPLRCPHRAHRRSRIGATVVVSA